MVCVSDIRIEFGHEMETECVQRSQSWPDKKNNAHRIAERMQTHRNQATKRSDTKQKQSTISYERFLEFVADYILAVHEYAFPCICGRISAHETKYRMAFRQQ